MRTVLPLLLLTACQTDNGSGSSGNDQTDLSGYATLEDLAALQATIDEQASRIEALEAEVGSLSGTQIMKISADCATSWGADAGWLDHPVAPVGAWSCMPVDGGEQCYPETLWTIEADGTYQDEGSYLMYVADSTWCKPGEGRVDFYYRELPAE